jgi:hypothetical protein
MTPRIHPEVLSTALSSALEGTVSSGLTLAACPMVGGAQTVAGPLTVRQDLTASAKVSFGGAVTIAGPVNITQDFTAAANVRVRGDITVSGDVLLQGADCAEQFSAVGTEPPTPGSVVVIDEDGNVRQSEVAYDKKVAGVVSGAGEYHPGLVLDNRPSLNGRIPVALIGKVYCKVDAQYAPIEVGDLLTSSPTPGYAMRATDCQRAFGSVLGKALRPLATGSGLIPVLVALQ